jgi:DNA polymerase-3 subunit alpha
MSTFIPLHVNTSYSILKSGLPLNDYLLTLKKNNLKVAGISDLDYFYSYPHFDKLARKDNIRPLFGLKVTYDEIPLVFYIKSETGYKNLLKLTYLLHEGTLSDEEIRNLQDGLILILPVSSFAFDSEDKLKETSKRFALLVDDFYLGLEHYDESDNVTYIREFSYKFNYKLVAFPLIKYVKTEDALNLEIINAIRTQTTLSEDFFTTGPYYFHSEEEIKRLYKEEEIDLTSEISNKIDFTFQRKRGHLLTFPLKEGENSKDYLHNLAYTNLTKRGLDNDEKYVNRLQYELNTIDKLGYNDYFLIVSDYVNFAINNGILVGPGRGSAPGSLVSYLLGITRVDPLKYNLLFERFLNESRQTMPDIDIDFSDVKRNLVEEYLISKYGHDKVANIITFQTNAARQSLRDIGRVYDVPTSHISHIVKYLGPFSYSLRDNYRLTPAFKTLVNSDKYYLDLVSKASKIEYLPRQTSMHAAGVILNDESLIDVLPVINKDNHLLSQYEMEFLESQGFLKMDLLGLTNLTTIENCLTLIKKVHGVTLDYYALPYDTKKTYELIATTKTMGIFQLESEGMKNAIRQIKPSEFEDIVALLALHRPGPMAEIPNYAKAKLGKTKVHYIHKDLEPILKSTYGIIIYQEQIMQIARLMAGMDLKDADLFRRAISKKDEKALLNLKETFINGAINNHYTKEDAENVFNLIYKFADYGFNRSHSVSYAIIASQMAYLKATYPLEFYAACLLGVGKGSKTLFDYIDEIKSFDIKLLLPSINKSDFYFVNENGALRIPLSLINGVSKNIELAILKERENGPYTSFGNFVSRLEDAKLSRDDYQALIEAGAFSEFPQSRATLLNQLDNLDIYLNVGLFNSESLIDSLHLEEIKDDPMMNIQYEINRLGFSLSGNPLDDKLKENAAISVANLKLGLNTTIAHIQRIKEIKTKKGDLMAFVTLNDFNNKIDAVLFPSAYATYRDILNKEDLYLIKGKLEYRNNNKQLIINELKVLEDNNEQTNNN